MSEDKILKIKDGTKKISNEDIIDYIDEYCSGDADKIEEIILPESLKYINKQTFANLKNLKKINFPSSLETIRGQAFRDCVSLESIELNEGLKRIGNGAFINCNLKSIHIPSTTFNIGPSIITGNKNLEEITIEKDNPYYSDMGCNVIYTKLTHILIQGCKNSIIPNNIEEIHEYAFYNTGFEKANITIPESVIMIGNKAFDNCNIKEVKIKGNPRIAPSAFENNNIENIYLYSRKSDNMKSFAIDENANIYIVNEETTIGFDLAQNHCKQIKPLSLNELIEQNKSIKEINKIYKNIGIER